MQKQKKQEMGNLHNKLTNKAEHKKLKFNLETTNPYTQQNIDFQFNNPWGCSQNFVLFPTFNDTFVVGKQGFCDDLYHIKKNGAIIKKLNIQQLPVRKVNIMMGNLVLISMYDNNTKFYFIYQWNLQTNQVLKFPFFQENQNKQNTIFKIRQFVFFGQTNLMCIQQKTIQVQSNKKTLKHIYYQLPLKQQKQKSIYQQNLTQYIGVFKKKINHKSQYVFALQNDKQNNHIIYISGLKNKGKQKQIYKLQHKFIKQNLQHFSINIIDIWQPIQGNLYIRCKVQLNCSGYDSFNEIVQNQKQYFSKQKQIDFIWSYKQNTYKILNQSYKFDYILQFTNGLRQIYPYINMQPSYLQYQVMRAPSDYKQCNIFYYNYFSQQILAIQEAEQKIPFKLNQMKCKKTYFCLDDKKMYAQYKWRNDPDGFFVNGIIRKINLPQFDIGVALTFFIQNMMKNCNEDLLADIIKLIDQK